MLNFFPGFVEQMILNQLAEETFWSHFAELRFDKSFFCFCFNFIFKNDLYQEIPTKHISRLKIFPALKYFQPKIFPTKNISCQKYFPLKIFPSKNISRQKYFPPKNIFCPKYFPPKIFPAKNISRQKYFPPKIFPAKNISLQKYFLPKIFRVSATDEMRTTEYNRILYFNDNHNGGAAPF